MTVLGIDLDTRAVHCVLLDDDTNHARYLPVPFVDHRPPFRFDDARNIREALLEALCRKRWVSTGAAYTSDKRVRVAQQVGIPHMDSVTLVGIEKPYAQGRGTAYTYGLITGAILSAIPRGIPVLDMPPNDRLFGWKALSVGRTNATKDDVVGWAVAEIEDTKFAFSFEGWPQDAFDAYCIARAARRLNEQAVDAA